MKVRLLFSKLNHHILMLKFYNVPGNNIATLVDEYEPARRYKVQFDVSQLALKIYFYKIDAGNFVET